MKKILQPVSSYVGAKTSARDDDLSAQRLAVCRACPYRKELEDGREFCTACVCPRWRDSELKSKTRMVGAKCPEEKWS